MTITIRIDVTKERHGDSIAKTEIELTTSRCSSYALGQVIQEALADLEPLQPKPPITLVNTPADQTPSDVSL